MFVETDEGGSPTLWRQNHKNSYNSPYKFNGKEQDSETGYYYYGARYYNPRVSLWLNVDPLADYNPFYNTEHYIDGQHNGGVYNSGNLNPYIYCYQNPVRFIDPNGKQVDTNGNGAIFYGKFRDEVYAVADKIDNLFAQASYSIDLYSTKVAVKL